MIDTQKEIEALESRARKAGLTARQLCKLSGIAEGTFSRWKHEHQSPTFAKYNKLAKTLEDIENDTI